MTDRRTNGRDSWGYCENTVRQRDLSNSHQQHTAPAGYDVRASWSKLSAKIGSITQAQADAGGYLQSIDYRYNIRGWLNQLTMIN